MRSIMLGAFGGRCVLAYRDAAGGWAAVFSGGSSSQARQHREEQMENKSIGGALVEVFDAALGLVKTEINTLIRRVSGIIRAKGLGVVLLLASLAPLTLALIFLILFVFYGLMRLGLGAWAAALLIALVSFALTGALIFLGLKRLGAELPGEDGPGGPLSDIARDDLTYGAQAGAAQGTDTHGAAASSATASAVSGASGAASTSGSASTRTANDRSDQRAGRDIVIEPVPGMMPAGAAHPASSTVLAGTTAAASGGHAGQATYLSGGQASGTSLGRHGGTQDTSIQGTSTQGKASSEPEADGVPVSTTPTFREDMKKEGY